jgi:hypothetical protein
MAKISSIMSIDDIVEVSLQERQLPCRHHADLRDRVLSPARSRRKSKRGLLHASKRAAIFYYDGTRNAITVEYWQ